MSLLAAQIAAGYGTTTILRDVQLSLEPGEVLGLAGGSGQGKSTLVLALLGLLTWQRGWVRGKVMLEGVNLLALPEREARKLRGRRVALVPQSPLTALNGAVSLRKHFQQAWLAHQPRLDQAFESRLDELLQQVQLPGDPAFLARRPGAVSVGQAQRAVIALAMLHRPALLIADEPTSALDACTQAEVLKTLRALNHHERTAILYISHDLLSILQFCSRLAVLDGGTIVESAEIANLDRGNHHPVTEALLTTLPVSLNQLLRYRPEAGILSLPGRTDSS